VPETGPGPTLNWLTGSADNHLVRFGDHALARFELGLLAGQKRDEATVETLENLGDTMRVRSDRASRCKRALGGYSDTTGFGGGSQGM
jgi:hypothetical protein